MATVSEERQQPSLPSTCAYALKPLVQDIALTDGSKPATAISCIEYWEGNLYVGTYAGELLHYVSLPSENASGDSTFILASRLEPTPSSASGSNAPGVQRVVILPRSNKACILCNNVLTFHSLPELSPAAGNRKVSGCQWVGGLDLDLEVGVGPGEDVVMIGLSSLVRIVRIGDAEPKGVSKIQFPRCLEAARRGRFACVADAHHYALIDIDNRQKIPLFPIGSLDSTPGVTQIESLVPDPGHERSTSVGTPGRAGSPAIHGRQASLGDRLMAGIKQAQVRSRSGSQGRRDGDRVTDIGSEPRTPVRALSPQPTDTRTESPRPLPEAVKPLPPPPPSEEPPKEEAQKTPELLVPHITSPTGDEFLLTTGTGSKEPGVGMFVNLDGDVVRGTIEFGRYPSTVVVDSGQGEGEMSDGYVLAAYTMEIGTQCEAGVEVQRWDLLGGNKTWTSLKSWTADGTSESSAPKVGVAKVYTAQQINLREVSDRLRQTRFRLAEKPVGDTNEAIPPSPAMESADELFWSRMTQRTSYLVCWSGNNIHCLVKKPLITRLEASLDEIIDKPELQQGELLQLVGRIQNTEVTSEADFLSLAYMRQKISLIAFQDLATNRIDINPQISEKLFVESDLDPRVIISMVPLLRTDIEEGATGIKLSHGLLDTIMSRLAGLTISLVQDEVLARPDDYDVPGLIKRYLQAWRQRKGFGSIPDETEVFASVDAALLHLLLHQDQQSSLGPGRSSTLRIELYSIVDHGVSCPERAVALLEEYKRLYPLSRLYGIRRSRAKVLETWRRMMEGEGDAAGEFQDRENEMLRYLGKTKEPGLVEEYGTYLAKRNPPLGVQVFTNDTSVVKLPPKQVVQLLQMRAPEAVKVYLEHLVFGKKNFSYANELISYYLTSVLDVLENPDDSVARDILIQSYAHYRALDPPKPTYRQFITENAVPDLQWWNDRLRLLELLGGTFGTDFHYDVPAVLSRIQHYDQYLVPESIILDGRQGQHARALHLLTHGLGDYHTGINYCLLGGASIFHPAMAIAAGVGTPDRDEQKRLFAVLLNEFMGLEDEEQRHEQVGELLSRFENWFEIEKVLPLIPEDWPIEILEGFLVGAIRRLVHDRAETMIVKALSGAENIIVANDFAEKSQVGRPMLITEGQKTV